MRRIDGFSHSQEVDGFAGAERKEGMTVAKN